MQWYRINTLTPKWRNGIIEGEWDQIKAKYATLGVPSDEKSTTKALGNPTPTTSKACNPQGLPPGLVSFIFLIPLRQSLGLTSPPFRAVC